MSRARAHQETDGPPRAARSRRAPPPLAPPLAILVFVACLTSGVARAQEEAPVETLSFSIPDTRIVKARFESAQAHVAARRFSEALFDLQKILEENAGDVLPGERPVTESGRTSEELVHPGAALRARALLFGLPSDVRETYRLRHEPEARAALTSARARHDVRALSDVAQRWPLCAAAEEAAWTVGDLELERGAEREAVAAFARALALGTASGAALETDADWNAARARTLELPADPRRDARVRRIDFAIARRAAWATRIDRARLEGSLRLPGPGQALGPPPSVEGDAWPAPRPLPRHPLQGRGARSDALFCVRQGETLFVSTTMRLFALQAYTGEIVWDSGEARGWSDKSEYKRNELASGVDAETALVAPAASEHVVVAALQLPFAKLAREDYSNFAITRPMPERRLFAFDVATGRKLWDHAPPPLWDMETGSFTDRMSIGGPPVIAGSRVLAPCVLMQGRIDYQVGCFDLETGALLWSTEVVSGQRELNMFGRAEREFSTAPLCVEGDKVIALTQLGVIAALDLFSGEILWETRYNQIELPRTRQFQPQMRYSPWRNCPPVVSGGVVVAIPFASRDLIAVDLASGALLWSQDHVPINQLSGKGVGNVDLLLGADENTIYLGGDRLVALELPAGLRVPQRLKARWTFNEPGIATSRRGRPILGEDRIVVPCFEERVEVARADGRRLGAVPWPGGEGGGNLLLGSGEIFYVSGAEVQGVFEWDVLVGRARRALAERPGDSERVLRLARMLGGRASNEWQRGHSELARTHFAEARAVLERARAADADDSRAALAAELHGVLRGEARVRAGLADGPGALAALRAARSLAPDRESLRDTLLEELATLREREGLAGDDPVATRAALAELERSCADLPIVCEARLDSDGGGGLGLARFRPLAGSRPEANAAVFDVSAGAWVLFERVHLDARARDTAAEYADLHAILERHGEVELPIGTAGELARERIGALLASGRREGFARFEEAAERALDAALAARDPEALARVARAYPFAKAARRANDARLELALAADDVSAVASIVTHELPAESTRARAGERDVRLYLRLASVLGRAGNRAAAGSLLEALAQDHGPVVSDVPEHRGARIEDLAAATPRFGAGPRPPPAGEFGRELAKAASLEYEYEFLGLAEPSTPPQETPAGTPEDLVFARSAGDGAGLVIEFHSSDPARETRSVELPARLTASRAAPGTWRERVAFAPGRVLLATDAGVVGIDTATARVAFERRLADEEPLSIALRSAAGVVVASVTPAGDPDRFSVVALESERGAELWRERLVASAIDRQPLLSASRVVFPPVAGRSTALVRDLFTGTREPALELEAGVTGNVGQDAWIEGETLIVPWFQESRVAERNQVLAFDLDRGRRAWRIGFEDVSGSAQVLAAVIQQGERTWLVLRAKPDSDASAGPPETSLHALDTRIGALTPLSGARLSAEDRILGASDTRGQRVTLANGPLLVLSPRPGNPKGGSREARLRCLDLDRGEQWVQGLGFTFEDVPSTALTAPGQSSSTIAVALPVNEARGRGVAPVQLMTFDRRTGLFGGRIVLRRADKGDRPELIPNGDRLYVRTRASMEILR